jgi:hypothetical protein
MLKWYLKAIRDDENQVVAVVATEGEEGTAIDAAPVPTNAAVTVRPTNVIRRR